MLSQWIVQLAVSGPSSGPHSKHFRGAGLAGVFVLLSRILLTNPFSFLAAPTPPPSSSDCESALRCYGCRSLLARFVSRVWNQPSRARLLSREVKAIETPLRGVAESRPSWSARLEPEVSDEPG